MKALLKVSQLHVGQELALTAGSSSSIEPEAEAEAEIEVSALDEEELRAELVKVHQPS